MQTIPIDIDPGQLVHWLEVECAVAPSTFKVTGTRSQIAEDIPAGTIGTLEITPAYDSRGWKLSVVAEDEVGPRVLDGSAGNWPEQAIDLGTFAKEFIRSGRGTANVFAEVEDAGAVDRVQELIIAIETDLHPSSSPPARGAENRRKARASS